MQERFLVISNPCRSVAGEHPCELFAHQTYPFCHLHTRLLLNLKVKGSRITFSCGRRVVPPMLGLFASRNRAESRVPLAEGGRGEDRETDGARLAFGPRVLGPHPETGTRTAPPGLICRALGEHLTPDAFDRRYPGRCRLAPYAIEVCDEGPGSETYYLDQARLRGITAYANDPAGPNPPERTGREWAPPEYPKGPFPIGGGRFGVYNARFALVGSELCLVATENIYDGDEIYVDYGRLYWQHWGG